MRLVRFASNNVFNWALLGYAAFVFQISHSHAQPLANKHCSQTPR
jgi:hypothetical protein